MRYSITIDNVFCMKYRLDIKQGYLYAWLRELPTWSEKIIIGNDTWYFASRNKACEELPLLTTKPDTMYRHYKVLSDNEIIYWKKVDGKDYIAFNPIIAQDWNTLKKDELPNTRINVRKNSEENPTNKNIIDNKLNKEALYKLPLSDDNMIYEGQKKTVVREVVDNYKMYLDIQCKNNGVPNDYDNIFNGWWNENGVKEFTNEEHIRNSVSHYIKHLSLKDKKQREKTFAPTSNNRRPSFIQ